MCCPDMPVRVAPGKLTRVFRIETFHLPGTGMDDRLPSVPGFHPYIPVLGETHTIQRWTGTPGRYQVIGKLPVGENVHMIVVLRPEPGVSPSNRLVLGSHV